MENCMCSIEATLLDNKMCSIGFFSVLEISMCSLGFFSLLEKLMCSIGYFFLSWKFRCVLLDFLSCWMDRTDIFVSKTAGKKMKLRVSPIFQLSQKIYMCSVRIYRVPGKFLRVLQKFLSSWKNKVCSIVPLSLLDILKIVSPRQNEHIFCNFAPPAASVER